MMNREVRTVATNRRALHDFFITNTYEAGIELIGSEVKSIRQGKVSLQEAYAGFKSPQDEELFIFNMHINPYEQSSYDRVNPRRERKLLVHKREAVRLKSAIQEKGMTIIPLSIYFSGPFVKVELGVAKAKRKYDKRETTKKRETEREIRRKFRI
ncbi:MAG: SsrA-binding protein SmpB [Candidatus Kapaibacterium sp.]